MQTRSIEGMQFCEAFDDSISYVMLIIYCYVGGEADAFNLLDSMLI